MQTKIQQFFDTHPNVNEVFSALGVLFTDKEKALQYLGGVIGKEVETFTRPVVAENNSQIVTGEEQPIIPALPAANSEEQTEQTEPPAGDVDETQAPDQNASVVNEPLEPHELEAGHNALLVGQQILKPEAKKAAVKKAPDKPAAKKK